jgi:pimeloyl-ACP methyl ester carboxylesterase
MGQSISKLQVTANGLSFAVQACGDGDRLALCLHGFPDDAIAWRHQLPVLAGLGFKAWAPNQRGYSGTSRPEGVASYGIEHLMDDVAGLIDASGARSTVLIGHDWGAMVAWCFAARRVRPLERLVIMNVPHPVCFNAALRHWRQMRKSWYTAFFQIPGLPDALLSSQGGARVREIILGSCRDAARFPREVLDTLCRNAAEPGAATAMLNWYRASFRNKSLQDPRLAQPIDTPTLLVWGEEDVALDVITLDGTERYVRDLTLRRLPGVSHWVQQEAPARVNAMLEAFLTGQPVPS